MAIEKEKQNEILSMIIKKAAIGTIIGVTAYSFLNRYRRTTLASIAFGYCVGLSLQSANQELLRQLQ